ncbi:hypothetical protein N7457_004234 [Penicillium paradoxum]|uniref:uncharacterized protein n=1 Tax=Penicillium paradoxum TaxID=176176 RepID=UPI00254908C2|nr:uncharacterized protein N7457_004234 [Penicillium paradoxum]KAJ5782460.1 hypothetical protein N7457_004234 [Penicillium paradoxum]
MSEHHSAGGPTLPIVILDQHLPILILDQQTHEFIRDAGGLQLTVIIHAEGHSDPTPLALVCSLVQPFPTNCDATNTQWVLRFEPLQHPPQIHAHTEVTYLDAKLIEMRDYALNYLDS